MRVTVKIVGRRSPYFLLLCGLAVAVLCGNRDGLAQCPATLAAWPSPPGNPVTAISPTAVYEGSVTMLRVRGTFTPSWNVQICPKPTTAVSQANLPTAKPDTSSSSTLQSVLTVNPGSIGDYSVLINDPATGKTYDSGKTLTVKSHDDAKYVSCAAPGNLGKPDTNLGCSFVPLSHETALEVFGKGVANRFIAVQVTVRNKNSNLEYLLQDVRVSQAGLFFSSYDRKIPRAVAIKEEQFSARAIVIRLTAATASVLTGVAGFAGNDILQNAANIFAGPAQTGLLSAIPDLSSSEIARMDDLGFSTGSTVIHKNSSIAVVAFIPSDTLNLSKTATNHWFWPTPNSYSTYKGSELQTLFSALTVSVAGVHVQETNPSQPTIKLFLPGNKDTVQLTDLQSGANPINLSFQGTGLDGVKQVQLSNITDNKTILPAALQPLAGEATIDPNVAVLTVPHSPTATVGVYETLFILADGTVIKTEKNITVTPGALTLSAPHATAGSALTITGAGFGASQGTSTVTFGGVSMPIQNWTSDTSITVTVPGGVTSGNVVVTVSGIASSPVSFSVP